MSKEFGFICFLYKINRWFINVKAFILDEFKAPINNKIITMNMNPEAPKPD